MVDQLGRMAHQVLGFALPTDLGWGYNHGINLAFWDGTLMIKRSALTLTFAIAMVFGLTTAGGAQQAEECGASPQPCVDEAVPGVDVLPSAPLPVVVAGPVTTVTPRQTLPVTGAETAALAIGGLVLVGAGGALVWRSNKAAA